MMEREMRPEGAEAVNEDGEDESPPDTRHVESPEADQRDETNADAATVSLLQFFRAFFNAKGVKSLVFATVLLALGSGCVVGVIPAQIADRYARLHHGYAGPPCASLQIKPVECQAGTDDAQSASVWSNIVLSLNALFFNPVVGSRSDQTGRRPMILASLFVLLLPQVSFLALIAFPKFHPIWYYLSNSVVGAFNFISLGFAAFSDIMPESLRAQSYGLFFAAFMGGYALSPSLPLILNHTQSAIVSLALTALAFFSALVFLPETLSDVLRENAQNNRRREYSDGENSLRTWHTLWRPFRELSIIAKDKVLILLSIGSFFHSMVFASDSTLITLYIEEHLDVGDKDIASMFLMLGLVGLVLQGGAIQPLVQWMGEKRLLVATFACGTFHNMLYGMARRKSTIYLALMVAQFTNLNSSVLASVASKDANKEEQGRIQGAFAALSSIAFSLGPLTMEFVYRNTEKKAHFGPGFMFYFASMLYAVGTCFIIFVPGDAKRNQEDCTRATPNDPESLDRNLLEEPLLQDDGDTLRRLEE